MCIQDYIGDPYSPSGCRPECVSNSECPRNLACINQKCKDPCIGACGTEAVCNPVNHQPICNCPQGLTGDPYRYCYSVPIYEPPRTEKDPCNPTPCGINSLCRRQGSSATCECLQGYSGNPYEYGCKPECVINADCPLSKACSNYKCVDPCQGVCGNNAQCKVINHAPICTCPQNMVGNPFTSCTPVLKEEDPCYPSPCAQNGICRNVNGRASCTYPECVKNEDCSRTNACFNQKCGDPCVRACGENALCNVINHKAGKNYKINNLNMKLNLIIFQFALAHADIWVHHF